MTILGYSLITGAVIVIALIWYIARNIKKWGEHYDRIMEDALREAGDD